jgi:cholesterol transport system auxiliary component
MQMQFPFSLAARLCCAPLLATLAACATAPARVTVYDFGPGASTPTAAALATRMAPWPALLLAEVEASAALDTSAVLYRLTYADAQQLRPYAQARWSMAPAQLLRQRLREVLGQRRSVLAPLDAVAPGTLSLRLELEEFSQLFESASSSAALVRVRATLGRSGNPAKPLAQTFFVQQMPSASADAAGGVRALALATDALIAQLEAWLQQVAAAEGGAP